MHRPLINLILVIGLIHATLSGKSVDILRGSISSTIDEAEILRVLSSSNKTDIKASNGENFTFVELMAHDDVGHRRYNDTGLLLDNVRVLMRGAGDVVPTASSNPYYNIYNEEIDLEAKKFLQIVPTFEPGVGDVSQQCKLQSDIYRRELNKFTMWALKMYDATAKLPSGLLNGNVNQLGDYDECVSAQGSDNIKGQYCLAYLQLDVDQSRGDLMHVHRLMHSHYAFRSNLSDPGHRVPRFSTINWALCVPSGCSSQDVETSLKHSLAKHTQDTGLKFSVKVEPGMCQINGSEPLPTDTLVVGLFFLGIIALSMISGILDHYNIPASPFVQAFSIKKNTIKLFSLERNDGDIATLHGIRALNSFMLILSHKSLAIFFNPYTNRTAMTELVGRPWTVLGRAASLYTDPFIMLSGLLTTYSFVGRLNKTGRINVRSEYISRLCRIIPTLAGLILFCTFIMPFIGSGPQWNLVVSSHAEICKKTWWRNFLFIHNYFGFENICLTHTHHLGIDMQLFAVSPLMVYALYKKPKIGFAVLSAIAIVSTALRFYVTYYYRLSNYVSFGISIKQLFDTANLSYCLPVHRVTVYIIGIFVGYLLRKWPKNYKLSDTVVRIGWFLSIIMALGAFFGPAGMGSISYVYNPVHAATYNAFSPIGWCAIFVWVTFLTHTGNTDGWLSRAFAWRGFLVTTRLSYAIYLTQFPVFFYNVGVTRSAEHIGFVRALLNDKELIWILLTSTILTLLFEFPSQNLRNYYVKERTLLAPKTSSTSCLADKTVASFATEKTIKETKVE